MRRIITIVMILFLCNSAIFGQAVEISGIIVDDENGEPVAGGIIQIKDRSGRVLGYTISLDDGSFSLKYSNSISEIFLEIRQMGYRTVSMSAGGLAFPLTIRLVQEVTVLNDVVVQSPLITKRSDTLSYYVSQYVQEQDSKISDVLKRLPGIEVEDDGQIKYNGEPINKFYIDGSDFIDGRYGLATENISPSDVATVDIIENHQPIRVLNGIDFSQQAGLNIKLKEGAKHRWVGLLSGGVGATPLLFDGSLFAMRIAGKWQNMEIVQMNSTGLNPASQSKQHIENSIFESGYYDYIWPDYIYAGKYFSPLSEQRTRDNLSFLVNTTNSWHLCNECEMMFNMVYESDRLDYSTGYVTNYFDSEIQPFTEWNKMRTGRHQLGGQWSLQVNRSKLYVKDNLYVDASYNDALSDISGTFSLSQKSRTPSFSVVNDLQLIKRINNNLLRISSKNRYIFKPHLLGINSDLPATQKITTKDFRSVTEIRYGRLFGNVNVYARGGVDVDLHDMNSYLSGVEFDYPMFGNLNFVLLNAWLSPEISWQYRRWIMTLSAPGSWHLHRIYDSREQKVHTSYSVNPSFYGRFLISAKTDIVAQMKYSLIPPSADMNIGCVIMTDFHNLYVPKQVYKNSVERSAAILLRYRNPVSVLFANMTAKFEWNSSPFIHNQLFLGDKVVTTFSDIENDCKIVRFGGGISKGLMMGRVVVNFDAEYAQSWSESMRQSVVSPYNIRTIMLQSGVKGVFRNWLSADYKLNYIHNSMTIRSNVTSSHNLLHHCLGFTFSPDNMWQIVVGGEHYYTKFNSGNSANLVLSDLSVTCNVSKRVKFKISSMNLLNCREYRYTDYGLLSSTDYVYRIRGRNILVSLQIKI